MNFIKTSDMYYKYTLLSNKQTAFIGFRDMDYYNFKGFCVIFAIANKKKHIKKWLNEKANPIDCKCTGKSGLEGLIWAKKQVKEFEQLIKEQYPMDNIRIEIAGADNRRFRIYKKAMKDYNYSKSESILYKKL
ncbi:hypothetical protein [Clostridium botulinum]|uniref:Uncharacterized protein n=1 Tax=Clostridium botulinum CFSAN001627 TaxID=1232189 RepID=M1ZUB6_CLOBO|nr:hypothetical protein [Clostridium botulinum]EKN42996.1 hypothetical protein CFSAN001627_03725 [Clostridium botulinum CFSAN001627]AXG97763.1 hypothetical protein AGE31_19420 [Clostridium botulinum]MBY6773596.1 hypothetical protein [Clostridium botulinum]MBY6850377.1 hypothetical protein [Clostridium botulinum]MBY6857437.1 hypothetical protein [Clostridium botulinum]